MRSKLSLPGILARSATLAATALVMSQAAQATDLRDAQEFHQLLRSSVPASMATDQAFPFVHMLPDSMVMSATDASSVDEAIGMISSSSLEHLNKSTVNSQAALPALDADQILAKAPMTMVIVPGIFGEFIPTRGFEDVLSQPSTDRDQFVAKVKQAGITDETFDLRTLKTEAKPLSDLVHVGSIKDKNGKTLARVVLLYTPFMSLESLNDTKTYAAIFNRRLQKYISLTGPQRLALVGYSRGTVLGLEMLAQAKSQNLPYLSQVKAMISLGGVAWGSNLADDTQDVKSASYAAIQAVKNLRSHLNPQSPSETALAWTELGAQLPGIMSAMNNHKLSPRSSDLKTSPVNSGSDMSGVVAIVRNAFLQLGLDHPIADFANNVKRAQLLIDAILSGLDSLTSASRAQWFATHTLPKNVTYMTISAAMANPELSSIDKEAFDGPYGYSNHSYDDVSLLQNRLDYETLSGVTLNDSQVSVAQTMFLPEAMAKLNSANAGLKTEFLGVVGTHHWGLALRVVNAMKDGRTNPFPREALLKSLAAKVALDSAK